MTVKQVMNYSGLPRFSILLAAAVLLLVGCGEKVPEKPVTTMPESFTYMEIGANTVIDGKVRGRLQTALGSEAVDLKTTIYLDLKYKGFLERYYPDLHELNSRLNVNDVVRKEHPATRISFRNTRSRQSIFDYVELTFENRSRCPLLFKFRSRNDLTELVKSVSRKYGPPSVTSTEEGRGESLRWQLNGDVFVIARFPGRLEKDEYHMIIVYANRINQMLAEEAREERQKEAARNDAERKMF